MMRKTHRPLVTRLMSLSIAAVTIVTLGVGAALAFGDLADFAYRPTPITAATTDIPALPVPDTKGMDAKQVAEVRRGEYLTAAGDCMPCHTAPGGEMFAGGKSFVTPFGTLYSPNITPDKATGIGNWNGTQFWNAVHWGIAPGSSLLVFPKYLFPAMPYTSYAKLSKPDVMAIRAYLDAIPPVKAAQRPNSIGFPFNIRAGLLTWRLLFFNAGPVHYKKSWSPAVRHGAYLAEALGHCDACHSPRNFLFATKQDESLAGTRILGESWFAPNISSSKKYGLGGWSRATLVAYLHAGGDMKQGAPFGPMKAVVDFSLSQLPESDINDLAAYLQTATPPRETPAKPVPANPTVILEGKHLYAANCAACHQANGAGVGNVFPNLAGNQSVWNGPPDNLISAMLGGLIPWHKNGPAMPSFADVLNDHEIAAIANYVRTAWGNPGVADATAKDVLKLRETAPPRQIALADRDYLNLSPVGSAAARKLGCPLLSTPMSDPGNHWMTIMEGVTADTLPNRTRALIDEVSKLYPNATPAELTNYAVTGYCPVVAAERGLSRSEKRAALARFRQSLPALISGPEHSSETSAGG